MNNISDNGERCLVEICINTDGDFTFDGHKLFTKVGADYEHHIWIADFPSIDEAATGAKAQLLAMIESATGRDSDVSHFKKGMMDWIELVNWCIANKKIMGCKSWGKFDHEISNQKGSMRIHTHKSSDGLAIHKEILGLASLIGFDSHDYYSMVAQVL